MKKLLKAGKSLSVSWIILITAVLTFAATALTGWLLGFHPATGVTVVDQDTGEKTTLWTCGMHPRILQGEPGNCPICGMKLTPKRKENKDRGKREIAYWRAPMNPKEIYKEPGKSTMGMDLIPVYENELSGGASVSIDPETQQNMGIRKAKVAESRLFKTIRTYGHVTYDETGIAQINPKVSGWVEKIHVNFTGRMVKKGEPLFDIYSPELLTAQEEYLGAIRRAKRISPDKRFSLLKSARLRLQYFDVPESEIKALEKSGQVTKALTIRSPFQGVVIMKNIEQGSYLKAGVAAYRIADLSRVWVEAHIYEYDIPWVSEGQEVEIHLAGRREKVHIGKISHIYPYLQSRTRDMRIRVELQNPDLSVKPDMYADALIKSEREKKGLVIPSEAIIRSGERNIVFVVRENDKFAPREIKIGMSLDNRMTHVAEGLAKGETIVVSGQFLIDSESQLKEATRKMLDIEPDRKKSETVDDDFFDDLEN